jgi:hypothetical protein
MTQPGGGEIESRLPVGECSDDAGAPPDLAQDTLKRIVGADAPPLPLPDDLWQCALFPRTLGQNAYAFPTLTFRAGPNCFDLLAAVTESQSANKKEPEAVSALKVPELCLNLGF